MPSDPSSVTEQDVRDALNGVSTSTLESATIQRALDYARVRLDVLTESETGAGYDPAETNGERAAEAVIAIAARRAWASMPQRIRKAALDADMEWNAEAYLEELRSREREALSFVGVATGGTTAPFATTTSGVFDATGTDSDTNTN